MVTVSPPESAQFVGSYFTHELQPRFSSFSTLLRLELPMHPHNPFGTLPFGFLSRPHGTIATATDELPQTRAEGV